MSLNTHDRILIEALVRKVKDVERVLEEIKTNQNQYFVTLAEVFSHLSVEHYWTGGSSYIDRTGAFFKVDGDKMLNHSIIFESIMAVEQSGRTAYIRIYNVTDSNVLAGSELTTTQVGISNPAVVRSSPLTFPSGEKQYKLQIRQNPAGNGGDNAHFYAARFVIG